MRKLFLLVILTLASGAVSPLAASAEETDLYADSVYLAGNQAYQPSNALGAPDQVYTDFFSKEGGYVTLDMGENEEGIGDLTLYYRILNTGAGYRVDFKDADLTLVQSFSAIFSLGTSELTITYLGGVPYRYVTVTSIEEETWSLDAVTTASILETEETTESEEAAEEEPVEEETVEETEEEESCGSNQGLIVKRPDDGNPETDADSIVYTIGCDNTLHIFPDEQTFKTWWTNFDDMAFINGTFIAQHELGNRVTIRPGTWLIKQTSDPKVYAIEPDGVLRWLPDETTAAALYGENWAARVIDVPDAFFSDYTIGDDLTAEAYPTGTIGYLPTTNQVVYLEGTGYRAFVEGSYSLMRFQSKFLIDLNDTIMTTYTDGGELTYNKEIDFPF